MEKKEEQGEWGGRGAQPPPIEESLNSFTQTTIKEATQPENHLPIESITRLRALGNESAKFELFF